MVILQASMRGINSHLVKKTNYNYTFRPYVGVGYTVKQDFMFSYPVYSGYAQGYYMINTN